MWKAQHWIDHLAPAKRIVAWVGIVTAAYLGFFLIPVAIVGDPLPTGKFAVTWVVLGTVAGRVSIQDPQALRIEPLTLLGDGDVHELGTNHFDI